MRPERHYADSFATIRIEIMRVMLRWLDRCPTCLAPNSKTQAINQTCSCAVKGRQ